jgi:hypothetical protein
MSQSAKEELNWWMKFVIQKNGLPIQNLPFSRPDLTIYTDSSETGWGVSSPTLQTFGFWTKDEQVTSINVRELKAIFFALKLHAEKYRGRHIEIFSDNTTALKYTKKSGRTSSMLLQDLAVQIQDICNQFHLHVTYHHIPGVDNIIADQLSRVSTNPLYEAALPWTTFHKLQRLWGPMTVDAFASRQNNKLPTFWSLRPDPEAQDTDALQQNWPNQGLHLFPPWKLIPRVLQKLKLQKTKSAILISPYWPTQHWFPLILQMKHLAPPFLFKMGKWTMTAGRLSGKHTRSRDWPTKLLRI